ncbi:peptidase domain-containing ABC transporter [Mucilaginibacter pedocola]|uniref:ABC transporter ATP-binding protein n=1 Tax=Mucilaginibacter pedocola TaxID=1792845 RepID=A0A1S9P721_9SPHI|nr:peptidase domain-containing ABC transporter [Mucilaginibacter pedocola]OOQ56752.1 ABC transporter ATP-binding protein [Mucilaginibacter pedocola]
MSKAFPIYKQLDGMDCGPTCLRMISQHYGRKYSARFIKKRSNISKGGTSLLGISDAAENIGFRTIGLKLDAQSFYSDVPLPCIVHWNLDHFLVVHNITPKKNTGGKGFVIHVADPAKGKTKYNDKEFEHGWISTLKNGRETGHCLVLEPTPEFYRAEDEVIEKRTSLFDMAAYLRPFKKLIVQLILCFVTASLLQLFFPIISQSIIDKGVNKNNLNLLTLLLIAQLTLSFGQTSVTYIQSWITLHLTTRIDIALITDFLARLMRMPLSFFDSKLAGDVLQRVNDNNRIQGFLTSTSINLLFAVGNFIVFSCIMLYYNALIFLIFITGSAVYVAWITGFLKYRRDLDNRNFVQGAGYQNNMIEMISGMQEIKLNNCEKQKRWQWERIQVKLFKIRTRGLMIGQYQQGGAFLINSAKNLFISYFTARSVIEGQLSVGVLFSIQYIIGQLNSPIEQFVSFSQSLQDAQISLERLSEVKHEETEDKFDEFTIHELPAQKNITITDLTYRYEGPASPAVLDNVSLTIPENKVTAIVGVSGSGKTTLLKMLLGFYKPEKGHIMVGDAPFEHINCKVWRQNTGTVLQDSFIFSDTIANNIAISDESVDRDKLLHAVTMANIKEFIESLALRYNTQIGAAGHGISQGQKQRMLIARAIYKNPQFIFLDEATNSLDANNEKVIMDNLNKFFKGKTVVVVAHRLSTVKNADKIVVIDKGKIVEEGTHDELSNLKGHYYNLVKNQLELGN